ncbi:MAG: hypothetical protein AAF415_13615 [Pseudomonadota bacterium]
MFPSPDLMYQAAGVLTAGAMGFALHRLYLGQRWRVAEFVNTEMRRFEAIREVRNACVMLDYTNREIDFGGDVGGQRWGRVDRAILIAALCPPKGSNGLGFPLWRVRDTFAVFFAELGRFESLIRAGLFSPRELEPHLGRRLGVLAGLAGRIDRPTRDALWQFLHRGGYDEVIALMRRFGHEVAPPDDAQAKPKQLADQSLPPQLVPRDSLVAARLLPRWDARR